MEVGIGHLVDYQSDDQPWRGLAPGRTRWEATYQVDKVTLARPDSGSRLVDLRCHTCGRALTVRVRSRRSRLMVDALYAGLVAVGGLAGWLLEGEAWSAALGGLLALYLAVFIRTEGRPGWRAAVSLAGDAPAGHRVWEAGSDD